MFQRLLAKSIDESMVDALIKAELALIVSHCSPLAVYLFGSAASGRMTEASDLDFLIVLPDGAEHKSVKKKYHEQRRGGRWPVDVVFMGREEFLRCSKIGGVAMICVQEGKLLQGAVG